MSRETGIKVSDDGELEKIMMALIRAPGLKANVGISKDVVEGEDLDGCDASEAIEITGREFLGLWGGFVVITRSYKLRNKAVGEAFAQFEDIGRRDL